MKQQSGKYDSPVKATLKGISDLFRKLERVGQLQADDRLDGRTVLITGASSGLGLAAAEQLARRGARVLMACRSGIPEKGETIRQGTGNHQVEMLRVDLSDLDSIRSLVSQLKERKEQLDIVICNAAIVPRQSRRTAQGLEEMFVVNYLAKFLLLRLLWQEGLIRLKGGEAPRLILVSSESHRNPKSFEWENFGRYQDYGMDKTVARYGYYKLLLTTFASELSRRLQAASFTASVFALCPGPVNSNIAREAPAAFQPLLKVVFGIFFKSPEKAAEPVLYLAASPDVAGKSTDYLFLMSRREMDPKARDAANGKRLWEMSEQLLSKNGISLTPL